MAHGYYDQLFTSSVKAEQAKVGSETMYSRHEGEEFPQNVTLGPSETAFIGQRDSFYLATVSDSGFPYIQHRGGPKGFLKVLDGETLAFPDYRGNRQYITSGNIADNDRVSLFLMDYVNKRRLKLIGHMKSVEVTDRLPADSGYRARVERQFVIKVRGFDWNCPQHITERFALEDVQIATQKLTDRIKVLEEKLTANNIALP